VESLGVTAFASAYRGRRVLVTGHTGFKGSWLALWLAELGAEVHGLALDPDTRPSHWELLDLKIPEHRADIRNAAGTAAIVQAARPEIVFHLAAQSLVRRSYRDPLGNWATNVLGTAHVLEACRQAGGVRAVVAVTSDKVYANQEEARGYTEEDRLGGHDPYSASKAACEILIESYRRAYLDARGILLASARAGNVVGGGDWCEDRLVPDLARAIAERRPLVVRSPRATRPWQHVLECLSGYLQLGQKLLAAERAFAEGWNFGPGAEGNRTVEEVLGVLKSCWQDFSWELAREPQPHEAKLLYLDHSKATRRLGWRPVWPLARGLEMTAAWYRAFQHSREVLSRRQLQAYIADARSQGVAWAA
jgi:CDP-glucose 4,6-dehydratase